MKFINRNRGTGKTSMLISTAYIMGMPIITSTHVHKNNILDVANRMNVQNNIDVYTVEEWKRIPHHNEKVLIDDVEIIIGQILSEYLNTKVVAGTMTIPIDNDK